MSGELTNTSLGRFHVRELLGRGGMGEVYRAHDPLLGRDLAIKVLPAELTRDPVRVERFMTEARAASALNHPHLITIYEIGSTPVHYIAMELVHGRTLRAVLESGRPEVLRALGWLLQVADALGAAHGAGVVHRDVKPENLMIADEGYAKVLDFGVAKLRADTTPDDQTRAALTDAGVMIGTSGYMSPEQARGEPADHRTDVFALGCVIYECLTGARAFDAPSAVERLHRVIHDEPDPIVKRSPQVPVELASVVRKCLAKRPDERYQSMKELAIDLRHVRRQLDSGSVPVAVVPGRRRPRWIPAAAVALAVTAGLVWLAQRRATEPESTTAPVAAMPIAIEQLTTSRNTIDAVISPDGAYLAHVEALGAAQSLWVRDLRSAQDRQIVAAGSFSFYGLQFAPDGTSLFYTSRGDGYANGRLMAVPRDGGEPRMVLADVATSVTFSPDGQRLAYYRERYPDQDSSALVVTNVDGTGLRVLTTRRAPEALSPGFFTAPSWSPDGRTMAFSARNRAEATARLIALDVDSGTERELHRSTDDITFAQWLPDGSGVIFVMRAFLSFTGASGQLWLRPVADGPARRLTNDLVDYRRVSVTADGLTLTAVGSDIRGALYSVPLDGTPPRRLRSERYDGLQGVQPLKDGALILTTVVNGEAQILRLSADGATRTVLTTDGANTFSVVSPDESTVAMVSTRDGEFGVWRMDLDGRDQRLLAHVPAASWLSFTPDSQAVICTSYVGGGPSTWRVPIGGGQPEEIARNFDRGVVSPDGRWLGGVYVPPGNRNGMPNFAAVMPLDGSAPPRNLAPMFAATGTGVMLWAPDGSGLIVSTAERFNLHFYGTTAPKPRQLTTLADDVFLRGALAPDGKRVIATRGVLNRDVFSIRGFR